jgi:hypothetical protein
MELEERLARLEAQAAIVDNLHRYGHAIDAADEAAWVDVFAPEGEFQVRGPSATTDDDYTISGAEELLAFVKQHSRRPEAFHEHVMVQPVIELADDLRTAQVRSRFFVIVMDGDRPALRVFGTYHDTLRVCEDGRWRFVVRRPEIDANAPDLAPLAWSRQSS